MCRRLTITTRLGGHGQRAKLAASGTSPGGSWRPICHDRFRHRRGPSGPGLRRSRLRRAAQANKPALCSEGPRIDLRRRPRRQIHRRSARLPRRWVKDCDRTSRASCATRLLCYQEQYLHDYPFCWRAEEDPLIQYPRKSWFIRTSHSKSRCSPIIAQINWLPEHIKDGRFGNFLETNVDWALSRERIGARRCRFGSATQDRLYS